MRKMRQVRQRLARATRTTRWLMALACALHVIGCKDTPLGNAPMPSNATAAQAEAQGVKPPFELSGDLEGLMLSWFDAEGIHNANRRSEVPEHRRAQVRVDSLAVAPEDRLDPNLVYIADLRVALGDGNYRVQTMERAAFDALVDKAAGVAIHVAQPNADSTGRADNVGAGDSDDTQQANAGNDKPVVIYMASWCGACKQAKAYLRQRNVAFEEHDIEKDPRAAAEMQQKARAAGVSPRGVPVIDFRGTLVLGFDKEKLNRLISRVTI